MSTPDDQRMVAEDLATTIADFIDYTDECYRLPNLTDTEKRAWKHYAVEFVRLNCAPELKHDWVFWNELCPRVGGKP